MRTIAFVAVALTVAACTQASPVMETADGSYFISTRAAPAAGGTAGAYTRAQEEAVKFCATRNGRPVMVGATDRDVYQSAYGGAISGQPNGAFVGGMSGSQFAAGSANMRFRCE